MNTASRLILLLVCAVGWQVAAAQVIAPQNLERQDIASRIETLRAVARQAKEIALTQYREIGGKPAQEAEKLQNLRPDQFLERIAVQPPVGPSTIAAPAPKNSGPVPTVNNSVDGGPTTGDPAVALLLARAAGASEYYPRCTGTLVSQNVILTAAHCICLSDRPLDNYPTGDQCIGGAPPRGPAPLNDPTNWRVFFQHVGLREVKLVITDNQYRFDNGGVRNDLALLVLKDPVRDIVPAPLPTAPAAAASWTSGDIIGFGYSAIGPDGTVVSATILEALTQPGLKSRGRVKASSCTGYDYLDPASSLCSLFEPNGGGSTSTVCRVDSGGPLYDAGGVTIGVTSGRSDDNCNSGGTIAFQMATSYATHQAWITNQLSTVGVPTQGGRWPPFGENLAGVIERRNVGLFAPDGRYASIGWLQQGGGKKVLATINSSGEIKRFEVQTRQGKVLCRGRAGATWNVRQVDYCVATIPVGAEYRIVAQGNPAELLQYNLIVQ
ncbi:trypsin-like serine protease [Pseudoduganella sp. UC29_71]|uniref:trypsin-like serine protease n=1 Tax=Pseudoduganella sp. UC29_71 TaxID=3350174 RepID=UPI003671C9CE